MRGGGRVGGYEFNQSRIRTGDLHGVSCRKSDKSIPNLIEQRSGSQRTA